MCRRQAAAAGVSADLRQQARRLRRRPAGADRRARLAGRGRSRPAPGSPGAATPMAAASTGAPPQTELAQRLRGVELVLHNQDNREHDLLDSDDYYQFEGGLAATVRHLSGRQPEIFHNDHSRPEFPRVRTLKEEIGRVVRGRAANPKWLRGRDAARLQGRVRDRGHGRLSVRLRRHLGCGRGPPFRRAVRRLSRRRDGARLHRRGTIPRPCARSPQRFDEAIERGLWQPRRNSAPALLDELGAAGGAP